MPSYPIEPEKLLATADELAPEVVGSGRPAYTHHRRAVSTAYYAVFHALAMRVVDSVFAGADRELKQRVSRWIGHADIKTVCRWIGVLRGTIPGNVPPHINDLLVPSSEITRIDDETELIANGFLELLDKREQADYDHFAVFPRAETRGLIVRARRTVERIESVGWPAPWHCGAPTYEPARGDPMQE